MNPDTTRRARLGQHLRHNLVAYVALLLAVTMSPLPSWAAAQIGTKQIKNGAVTTAKIKNNAVTSAKVKNKAVRTVDLAPAARAYRKVVVQRESFAGLADGGTRVFNVLCPQGQVAVSGGGGVSPQLLLTGGTAGEVLRSHPIVRGENVLGNPDTFAPGDGAAPEGWRTVVLNNTGEPRNAFGYAVCAAK